MYQYLAMYLQIVPCKNDNALLHTNNCWHKTELVLNISPLVIKQKCMLLLEMSHNIFDCMQMILPHI
jgi:hypothetical protein